MDKRVVDHFDGDLSQANILPRKRDRYLAKYPAAPAALTSRRPDMARFICPNCDYVYDEAIGAPREGWPAGTGSTTSTRTGAVPTAGYASSRTSSP